MIRVPAQSTPRRVTHKVTTGALRVRARLRANTRRPKRLLLTFVAVLIVLALVAQLGAPPLVTMIVGGVAAVGFSAPGALSVQRREADRRRRAP
jgi:Flp pilus assembly protein TadB